MGGTDSIRPGWLGWLDAWRGLADNPVYVHFNRTRSRRRRRTGWIRRNMLVFFGFTGGIILHSLYFSSPPASSASISAWLVYILGGLLIIIGPPAVLWLAQGIYSAVYDSMCLLGAAGKRSTAQCIDDLTAIAMLDDREILVAAARILTPPLFLRVAVCALVLFIAKITIMAGMDSSMSTYRSSMKFSLFTELLTDLGFNEIGYSESLRIEWLFMPAWFKGVLIGLADTPTVLLCGALASVALVLLAIALGRGVRIGAAGAVAGAFHTLAQVCFIYPGAFMHTLAITMLPALQRQYSMAAAYSGDSLSRAQASSALTASIPIAAILMLAFITLVMLRARSGPRVRAAIASALPILAMAGGVAASIGPITMGYTSLLGIQPLQDQLIIAASQYDLACASMAVCNVVASAIPSGYLMDMPSFWGVHWTDWMRTPVLILLQVALITILAHFAREAVNLRRRESPE